MAVDNVNHMLSLEDVKTLTRVLEPDLLESASLVNDSVFDKLKINVIRNLENMSSLMVYDRHVGTTRRYVAGKPLSNDIGRMHERELKVVLSWNRLTDNIQNYREKEPFSVLGTNDTYEAPNSEFAMRQIAKIYAGDVLNCLFFGDEALGEDSPLGMYDGYFAKIAQDINKGYISAALNNYQEIDPIIAAEPVDAYDTFVSFYEGLDPKMKLNDTIYIYMSEKARRKIVQGYLAKYQGLQSVDAMKPGFRFLDAELAEIVTHPALGSGDCLIATTEYNFDFATDMNGAVAQASIKVANDPNDFNVLIYQIQTAQGVRIRQVSSDKFCVSNGKNTPLASMGGEYSKNTLTATANNAEWGSVEISEVKDNYAKFDKITLTATAEAGYEFVKWDDNATSNPRTISYSGFPEYYQAIFKKSETTQGGVEEEVEEEEG